MRIAPISVILHEGKGFTLAELLIVCAIAGIICAVAIPQLQAFQDASRGLAAARYVASCLQAARMEALKRSAHVAIGFSDDGGEVGFAVFLDGNGNGVRTTEVANKTDPTLEPAERLGHCVPGTRFGIVVGIPSIDGTGPLTGSDPIRIGRSELLSFSPLGGATPGTLYILGPDGRQWAVRVTGATGRVRLHEFDVASQKWRAR